MRIIGRASRCTFFATNFAALALAATSIASAQTPPPSAPGNLEEVVVTGSLIPQAKAETSTPAIVIQAEDLQIKGFTTVADALQHSAVATGAIQGPQFVGGFTPGAQTLSLFGLSPSYTKFLIDGRPIADYPALYNGTDIVTSIDGIPTVMIDRIDILPGGQSSIYGSDAIAGVVNILLKKKMSGLEADLRYGWTNGGGGTEKRIGLSYGFNSGALSIVVGGQYEKTDPIWGYQRPLTDQYFAGGASPQTAERDWLVFGLFGQANGDLYYMEDPASCANVASQFGGTVGLRTREFRGQYCGTFRSGFYTINNGTEAEQGYLHAGLDLAERTQLFADILVDHDETTFNTGTVLYSTANDNGPFSYYYDPNVSPCQIAVGVDCDLLNVQRIFSPEEAGNLRNQMNKDTKNSIRATLGIEGYFGSSSWQYQADITFTENKLTEATFLAFTDPITNFFAPIFGPNLGPDPIFGSQGSYTPDYAAFYQPITPAQYASFTGYATSYSRTEETLARAQITNSALFELPGGKAGAALVLEGGPQGWDYAPDPRFLNGGTYLYTATAGSGHRSRTAGTFELKLPVFAPLTLDLSDRYDDYRVAGQNVTKNTYTFGVEFRPFETLLFRGRYGTSFKAPTLSDEFQGQSGFFQTVTDYYYCTISHQPIATCAQANESLFGTTSGNPDLKPITAKDWDVGLVWTPTRDLAFKLDYLHWAISNEVQQQDSDQLLRTNSACLLNQLPITSPTCVEAIALVTRDSTGLATQISTPKVNVASENLGVIVFNFAYTLNAGAAGKFKLEGNYSDILKHSEIRFAGDPVIDLLKSPFYSTEFKTKANMTLTWSKNELELATYAERYGKTPNYAAQQTVDGYAVPGGGDVGAWTLFNLSASYKLTPDLMIQGNVNNLFNTLPPLDSSQVGIDNQPFTIFNYNNYGRSYFVGVNYKFGK